MSEPVGFELSVQQRLRVTSGQPGDSVALLIELPAGESADLVRERVDAAAARHDVLRSTLRRAPGLELPLQLVHQVLPVGWVAAGEAADTEQLLRLQRELLNPETGPVLAGGVVHATNGSTLVLSALTAFADAPTLHLVAVDALGTPVSDDPIQYPEYVAWQQERLGAGADTGSAEGSSADDTESADAAWRRLRADAEPLVLPFPAQSTHDPATEAAGPAVPVVVPAEGVADVDRWLTAWAVTLARLSGQDCVLLGVELDPRNDPELEGAAGPYTRVVPFAVTLQATGSFNDLAEHVRRDRALAMTWLEWAPTNEESSLRTVFSVLAPGSRVERRDVQLELRLTPDAEQAQLVVGSTGSVAFAEQVAVALANVLRTTGGALADTDVFTPDDVSRLVGDEPTATSTVPVTADLLAQADSTPDRLALTDGTTGLTYRQLVDRVDGLAAALLVAGAGPDAPVATYLPRSTDLIVAMLAAQRAGSGYLPLDIDQPAARLAQQLEIAGCSVLISAGGRPDGFAGAVVDISTTATVTAAALPAPAADGLSYVIFTSGSTGVPKGVAVPESALANYVGAIRALVAGAAGDRPLNWALVTSPTTDLGNTAVFPALASGGTLHVVPADVTQEPASFARYVAEHDIDVLKITPSHLEALLADEQARVLPREVLFVGGEALGWPLVERIEHRGDCLVVNHYGPTETTVGALVNPVDRNARRDGATVPIGRALAGDEAFVLDTRGRLAPVGAVGELAIGGAGLARGYWADDARTAERFVAHPYRPGRRVYLTGDLARQHSDGTISFLGRRDGQVKIRGFRIERGEIEAALLSHPGVQRAAVVVRTDVGPDRQLVGYVVSQVNPRPTETELRHHLGERLPAFMVPTRLVQLDSFPLRPGGKLDEAALPAPPAAGSHDRERPAGPTEQTIAGIFAKVLGLDDVGVTDDFFELGGHSLLATRIVVSIRAALDVQLPVYALFETPTVRGLAGQVDAVGGADAVSDDELGRMIAELDDMSDEEAAALLAAETGDPRGVDDLS